ncbi:amino acid permease [Pedobacter sp.]|jgi:APA family basic amino acid/polyamine antiporter|uniref:amino acid permease n=1 Tax=Pedobacter sp. TaxID=1411316 RepID=UPI002CAA59FF|nr:amino acid permease [Pedobacter sp.]HWW40850.1 amino acid permease [Pedobacter sp.]
MLKKSIELIRREAAEQSENSLKRTLGPLNLILIGVGLTLGAGLFSITGMAAANYSGPAVTISFIIAALGCGFAALCYAEFASMIPVAGSAYTYSYATMGELFAWIIGWDLVLEYSVGCATVAISWSQYLTRFLASFHLYLPAQLTISPFETAKLADGSVIHGWINIPGALIVVLMTLIIIRGTKGSAIVNGIIVFLKVGVVLVFIALGWRYIDPANYKPYIPQNTGEFGHYGWSGILRGAALVFFVFIGFDAVAASAQETKKPARDMPIGILGSLLVCTILFGLFAHVMTGLANYKEFANSGAPVAIAIEKTPYGWLSQAIILAILIGYTSVILIDLMAQSRMFYSISRDGLLPKVFSDVHPKFKTPYKSNVVLCSFISLFAAFVPMRVVGEMTSIGTLLAFLMVCIGILILRKTDPKAERPFKVPFVPLIPILGILTCLAMMVFMPADTWIRLLVWLAAGLAIYFVYGKKNSKLRKSVRIIKSTDSEP